MPGAVAESGFHGNIGDAPFGATLAEIHAFSPSDWEMTMVAEDTSDVVHVSLDEHAALAAQHGDDASAWMQLSPATITGFSLPGTISIRDVQLGLGDASAEYPQVVGHAYVRIHSSASNDDDHPAVELDGESEVPVFLDVPPDAICRTPPPARGSEGWTETPSLDAVTGTVRGAIHGHAFDPGFVMLAAGDAPEDGWALFTGTGAPDEPERGSEGFMLPATGTLRRGRFTSPAGAHGTVRACSWFRTAEVDADVVYEIELTEVDTRHCVREPEIVRVGTASGRVIAMYRDGATAGERDASEDRSWIAGTFTDVPIVGTHCARR